MSGDNWILTYYQGIKDGSFCVGRWIQLVYDYLVRGMQSKEFFFDQKKADDVLNWTEMHCYHTEGQLAPSPLVLEPWQKAMLSAVYGIVDENEFRQHREIFTVVGRKNGKTKLMSSCGSYSFQKEGYGTRVFCLAPKLDQADLVYNDIWQMITLDPEYQSLKESLSERDAHNKKILDDSMLPRRRQSDLAIPGANSTVKKIAFTGGKRSDGYNPSLVICDEVSSWEGDKGLKQYEVMKSGMGARPEGLLFSCTTSGYVNDGIFDELMKRSTRFLLGDSKEKKLLPFIYMIDDITKWNDINELRKSNPNLGVSVSVDYMLEEIAVAEGSLSKKREFMTKYCCVKQNSSQAWLDASIVENASGSPLKLEDFRGSYAVCGIDLSMTTDLTCATCVIEKDGIQNIFAHFWMPSEKLEEATQRDGVPYEIFIQRGFLSLSGENFVDYNDVYEWMISLVKDYEIYPLMTGYDRWSSQYLVSALKADGYQMDDVYQGDNLWGTMQTLEGLLKDKKINIGDNDLLKSHLLNSAVKMSAERGRGRLVKINQYAHIDGTAALLDSLVVKEKWSLQIGEQLKNEE
jgi:phage terminase large subunit-like protein